MLMDHPQKPKVFISYSHQDDKWLMLLLEQLKPLKDLNLLDCWSDKEIDPGKKWQQEIEQALKSAQVAVLLVSPAFLASDFIAKEELPPLLNAETNRELTIIWIPLSYSMYKHTAIAAYQAALDPDQPLDMLRKAKRNQVLVNVCDQILKTSTTKSSVISQSSTRQIAHKANSTCLQHEIDYESLIAIAIRPVLMIVYKPNGWYLQNKGRGPALNIIVAQKIVKGSQRGTWFNPVRVPTLAAGEELHLTWLGHENDTGLGASYQDEDGRPFTSVTGNDLTSIIRDKVFPFFQEDQIKRHWYFFEK